MSRSLDYELEMKALGEQGKYPDEKGFSVAEFMLRRRIVLLFCVGICIFCGLAILSLSIVLPVVLVNGDSQSSIGESSSEEDIDRFAPVENPLSYFASRVRNTTESQIDIYELDAWADREAQIERWLEICNRESVYLNTSFSQIESVTREQYLYSAANCKSRYEFRVRVSLDGDNAGDSYIDIKGNSEEMEKACTLPFEPARAYQTNSSSKCELDLHECPGDDKYSRETRIFFKGYLPEFTECRDLTKLYPNSFPKLTEEENSNLLKLRMEESWWVKKYSGYLDGDTRYEMTFSLRYHSTEDALAAKDPANQIIPLPGGEWSIRLFSLGEGFTDSWNKDVVEDIGAMYTTLMTAVGRPGYCD